MGHYSSGPNHGPVRPLGTLFGGPCQSFSYIKGPREPAHTVCSEGPFMFLSLAGTPQSSPAIGHSTFISSTQTALSVRQKSHFQYLYHSFIICYCEASTTEGFHAWKPFLVTNLIILFQCSAQNQQILPSFVLLWAAEGVIFLWKSFWTLNPQRGNRQSN